MAKTLNRYLFVERSWHDQNVTWNNINEFRLTEKNLHYIYIDRHK